MGEVPQIHDNSGLQDRGKNVCHISDLNPVVFLTWVRSQKFMIEVGIVEVRNTNKYTRPDKPCGLPDLGGIAVHNSSGDCSRQKYKCLSYTRPDKPYGL